MDLTNQLVAVVVATEVVSLEVDVVVVVAQTLLLPVTASVTTRVAIKLNPSPLWTIFKSLNFHCNIPNVVIFRV